MGGGRFQLPVVKTVEEHLGELIHCLPLCLREVVELVADKVCDCLREGWSKERQEEEEGREGREGR